MKHYDWNKTFSYDAFITNVCGARGIGKTYGLRRAAVGDAFKEWRFVELCRYASQMEAIENGYFDKLQENGEFKNTIFKVQKHCAYMAHVTEDSQDAVWQHIGYFKALTNMATDKQTTVSHVKKVWMDEVQIDRDDKYHRYLPNEYHTFTKCLSTIMREVPHVKSPVRVYLMSNAVDMLNPYAENLFGDESIPDYGYRWYKNKLVLLHYVPPVYEKEYREDTLLGRLLGDDPEADSMFGNKYLTDPNKFVERKSSSARFQFALVFKGRRFGLWLDMKRACMYICSAIPANTTDVVTLTMRDNRLDYEAVRRNDSRLEWIKDLYYMGALRYDTAATREHFNDVLRFFGVV